jgi:hypothetical protein
MPIHYRQGIDAADYAGMSNTDRRQAMDIAAIERDIEIIYPATWAVDHGPFRLYPASSQRWFVSHFAMEVPAGFVGAWYPREGVNRLRIHDPRRGFGRAAKVWNHPGRDNFEHWGGVGVVFEAPGELRPGWDPVEFTHHFWTAQGIGRCSIANEHVAVAVDGERFSLVTSRPGLVEIDDDTQANVAAGTVGPHQPLHGQFSGRSLIVRFNGRTVLAQDFPLTLPQQGDVPPAHIQAEFLALRDWRQDPERFEKDGYGRNMGAKGLVDGLVAGRRMQQGPPERALSLARVCQRLGDLDQANRLATLADVPESGMVLGLVAMEQQQPVDFGRAGWQADGLRALQARSSGNTDGAIHHLRSYLSWVPRAWYPRLWLAYWTNDHGLAQALAAENPASPEAQWVLQQLGLPNELQAMTADRPTHREHLNIFAAMAQDGGYRPLPRYPINLIEEKPW